MPFNLNIPRSTNAPLTLTLNKGEILFILGANGSGKSSLMHHLYTQNANNALRLTAHRQTWFSSNTISLTPEQRQSTESGIQGQEIQSYSRWRDLNAEQRANMAIYDLFDAENRRARSIAQALDGNDVELAKAKTKQESPIKTINELLRLSNLPVEISLYQTEQTIEQLVARKSGSGSYSIAQLSDGERNAVLLAANILVAKEGSLILIDEPERHLHRAIISPLLTHLFAKRQDCCFIISTHELMLPIDNPSARTLLIRNCSYMNSSAINWDADLINAEMEIDDRLKIDILGSRRKILFVEGTEQSLDKLLYGLVFSNVSVVAKSSCRDVEHAVSGLRDAASLHWLRAYGIVDNDQRTNDDIDRLKAKGIYALPVFSVESLYYHPEIQRRVAKRFAEITGEDSAARLEDAKTAALAAISLQAQHLSERAAERVLRGRLIVQLPQREQIVAGTPIEIRFDVGAILRTERDRIQGCIQAGNLSEIIARYPVRETPALTEIARKLGFQNRVQYEKAVRKLLIEDREALEFVRTQFGALTSEINTA